MITPASSVRDVSHQLTTLGVRTGAVIMVHTSYRALRPIENGPAGLIQALRDAVGPQGTIVMPSWGDDDSVPFDPATTSAAADLGVTADLFWRQPGVCRSAHPFAFAAVGLLATRVTADPLPLPPHRPESPVGRVHELDGNVLLLGVGHDANTTIHLAEFLAGVPYRVPKRCTILRDGIPVRLDYTETDHCCQRFALADVWLRTRGLQREGRVAYGHARLMRSRDVVDVVRSELERDPLVFLHGPEEGCAECEFARSTIAV